MRRPSLAVRLAAVVMAAALTAACTGDPERPVLAEPGSEPAGEEAGAASTQSAPSSPAAPSTKATQKPKPKPKPEPQRLLGIDASHYQGAIDWPAVAGDGVEFAYLKATEGTTYVDPTFADHREAATDAGIDVGGYHYFSLCTPGAAQAEHLADVLGPLRRTDLPPAVDLEVAGSCATPPAADALLAEVRAFLAMVEERTGQRPIVYLFPEFEAAYGFADDLAGYRQWVRRLGDRPPVRDWWIWQRDDAGTVAGIDGPVDINVRRP